MKIVVTFASGHEVAFDVDTRRKGRACFLLSIRKCGSTMVNTIATALAEANGQPFVNVGRTLFYAQVRSADFRQDPALRRILSPGNTYGGFREMPATFLESKLFVDGPKVLMIRDPRDALVSEYFSNARTHPIPEPTSGATDVTDLMRRQREEAITTDIDTYVLRRAAFMLNAMTAFAPISNWPTLTVAKYEDYIFHKAELIDLLAERFDWRVDNELTEKILEWADVRPAQEDPTQFIRKVTPGDHREKLRRETIEELNEILRPALGLFGYETGTSCQASAGGGCSSDWL